MDVEFHFGERFVQAIPLGLRRVVNAVGFDYQLFAGCEGKVVVGVLVVFNALVFLLIFRMKCNTSPRKTEEQLPARISWWSLRCSERDGILSRSME